MILDASPSSSLRRRSSSAAGREGQAPKEGNHGGLMNSAMIYLTGKLVGHPVFETIKKNQPMAQVLLETPRSFLRSGEVRTEVQIIPLVAFGRAVDEVRLLNIGDVVTVLARLSSYKFTGTSGEEKYSLSLVIESVFVPVLGTAKERPNVGHCSKPRSPTRNSTRGHSSNAHTKVNFAQPNKQRCLRSSACQIHRMFVSRTSTGF